MLVQQTQCEACSITRFANECWLFLNIAAILRIGRRNTGVLYETSNVYEDCELQN